MSSEALTTEQIIEKMGGPTQIRADLEAHEAVLRYFHEHEEELIAQHPQKWAAVALEGVVAVGGRHGGRLGSGEEAGLSQCQLPPSVS